MPTRTDWLAGGDRGTLAAARIERTAAALFAERGLDNVSVADVAAAAGCSRATLYRHVGSKSELVTAVLTKAARTVTARVEASVQRYQGHRRVVEVVLASVAAIRADPVLAQWLSRSGGAATDEFRDATPQLGRIAGTLTDLGPDDEAAQWLVRVVLSLLSWPLPDAAAERRAVERFVAPVLAARR